jgi:hypothetical protein
VIYTALPYQSEEENIESILQMMNEIIRIVWKSWKAKCLKDDENQ